MEHHALLYVGSPETLSDILPGDVLLQGADIRHFVLEQFGIEDARTLSRESSRRPVELPYLTFVVAFSRATHEAQNALLKTLEEPAPTSRFCIVVPREDVLIATVRSRLEVVENVKEERMAPTKEAEAFIALSYGERLSEIAERTKAKDTSWIASLLLGIEVWAHTKRDASVMRELLMVRGYITASGSSKKMLLEHLALSIPSAQS